MVGAEGAFAAGEISRVSMRFPSMRTSRQDGSRSDNFAPWKELDGTSIPFSDAAGVCGVRRETIRFGPRKSILLRAEMEYALPRSGGYLLDFSEQVEAVHQNSIRTGEFYAAA